MAAVVVRARAAARLPGAVHAPAVARARAAAVVPDRRACK
jgi:hypothetical protein